MAKKKDDHNMEDMEIRIYHLLDQRKYDEARDFLFERLEEQNSNGSKDYLLLAKIAGLLIDIASENMDSKAAEEGIKIFEEHAKAFVDVITQDSYYYNLGIGKEALYKVRKYSQGLPSPQRIKPELIEAKNAYYKASKLSDKTDWSLALKIQSNLAGNLGQAGRVVDAINYYQSILKAYPTFPQALLGLAENLDYWQLITSYPGTQALHSIIFHNYDMGLKVANLPPLYEEPMLNTYNKYKMLVLKNNPDLDSLITEFQEAEKEYQNHPVYIKFCLDNNLMLNEHSVYCKCNKAGADDLSIGRPGASFTGFKFGKLELLLNRLKSEFALARKMYFESESDKETKETVYFELGDNEVIGSNSEKLRSSFKACFGIFDKIAHGISYFYDLRDNPNEPIYFNSFLDKPSRWAKIYNLGNPHLTALYSIASDFNRTDGEFGFYKEWRNALEHNLLILTNDEVQSDPLKIFAETSFVQQISYTYFKQQALHLLQICRSAIFSFAYCIRMETIAPETDNGQPIFTISPK